MVRAKIKIDIACESEYSRCVNTRTQARFFSWQQQMKPKKKKELLQNAIIRRDEALLQPWVALIMKDLGGDKKKIDRSMDSWTRRTTLSITRVKTSIQLYGWRWLLSQQTKQQPWRHHSSRETNTQVLEAPIKGWRAQCRRYNLQNI